MNADFPVHTRCFGQGDRHALAIHCSLGHAGAWRGVGQMLSDQVTLQAFDLPGHGKSGDWDGQGDLHDLCTEIVMSMITQPTDLVGHSFGATVALRVAVENPTLVRSLTLIEPVLFAAAALDAPRAMVAYDRAAAGYHNALQRGDRMQAARLFNRLWGDGTPWAELRDGTRTYMADRMNLIAAQGPAIIEDRPGLLTPGRLEATAVPCVLIKGSETQEIIGSVHDALARRLPSVRHITVKGAGHMAPITHPAEVSSAMFSLFEAV